MPGKTFALRCVDRNDQQATKSHPEGWLFCWGFFGCLTALLAAELRFDSSCASPFGPMGGPLSTPRPTTPFTVTAMRSRCRRPGGISMPVGRSYCGRESMQGSCPGDWGLGLSAGRRFVGLAVCGWWRLKSGRRDAGDHLTAESQR